MAASDQKRDKLGRFADEGKGAITDMQLCARAQKRLIRLNVQLSAELDRHTKREAEIEQAIDDTRNDIAEICG
jgi:hypothetical protein